MSVPLGGTAPDSAPRVPRPWRRVPVLIGLAIGALVGAYFAVQSVRASRYRTAAEQALDRRDFATAKALADKLYALRPGAESLVLRIRTARRSGDEAGAKTLLYEFEQKFPGHPARDRQGQLLRAQEGSAHDVEALLADALSRGDAADPEALEAALIGGVRLLQGTFGSRATLAGGEAFPFLATVRGAANLWLRLRPGRADQVEGLVWRGQIHVYSNDFSGPDDFRAALALDPDHAAARFQLALAVIQASPQEAADHLERLRKRTPDDLQVTYFLATAYRSAGRAGEAKALFDEYLAARPDEVEALTERALLDLDAGQVAAAERLMARAIQLAPYHPRVNYTLAACLRAAGRPDEAKIYQDRYSQIVDKIQKN